jgi:hypothetical protein
MNFIINQTQYYIHVIFEVLAIIIVVPILSLYLITNWMSISNFYRFFFIAVILLTLIVDSYLIIKWLNLTK